ncbi:MAG: T9SS type A sorting domain-containing protein [Bacteroidia bacterium]
MKYTLLFLFTLICLCAEAQRIRISNFYNSNEPAICIDRTNPANMYVGCNQNSGSAWAGAYYSHDYGSTWDSSTLNSVVEPFGDPCMLTDDSGYVYFIHDARGSGTYVNLDRLICNRSIDHGVTYTQETYIDYDTAYGHDKPFACIDQNPGSPYKNNIYVGFLAYPISNTYQLGFCKSSDRGQTWSPVQLLLNQGQTRSYPYSALTTGPNGELYVICNSDSGILFNKSMDGGNTWMNAPLNIDSSNSRIQTIPESFYTNATGSLIQVACDKSNGPGRGNIYVTYGRNKSNLYFESDVYFLRSSDGGNTWSSPVKISDGDTGYLQFLPAIAVDDSSGNIFISYYDTRDYTKLTNVYMTYSADQGITFNNVKITDSRPLYFNASGSFFGHYMMLDATANLIRPSWTEVNKVGSQIQISVNTCSISYPLNIITHDTISYCDNNDFWTQLKASGNFNYTWTPAVGLSATTGSSVFAFPTGTITYTAHGTDSYGNQNTQLFHLIYHPYANPGTPNIVYQSANNTMTCYGGSAAYSYLWHLDGNPLPYFTQGIDANGVGGDYDACVINTSGCMACSNSIFVTGIEEIKHQDISIYPNPVLDKLTVSALEKIQGQLRIFDLSGKLIAEDNFSGNEKTLFMDDLKPGTYVICLETKGDMVFRSKFIKVQPNRMDEREAER